MSHSTMSVVTVAWTPAIITGSLTYYHQKKQLLLLLEVSFFYIFVKQEKCKYCWSHISLQTVLVHPESSKAMLKVTGTD